MINVNKKVFNTYDLNLKEKKINSQNGSIAFQKDISQLNMVRPSIDNLKAYFMNNTSFAGKILKGDKREWLETGGQGAYASSTVSGANSRTYHGLLMASLTPPVDRKVILSAIEEEVDVAGNKSLISEAVFGHEHYVRGGDLDIESFRVMPVPTWKYKIDTGKGNPAGVITKQVVMPYEYDKGKGTVVIGYTYEKPEGVDNLPPITLTLRPLINFKPFHYSESNVDWKTPERKGNQLKFDCTQKDDSKKQHSTYLAWDTSSATYKAKENCFYNNFFYDREAQRGLNPVENNVFNPGEITITLQPGESITLTSSASEIKKPLDIKSAVKDKSDHLEKLYNQSGLPKTDVFKMLQRAADQFVVYRQSTQAPTIIAGYHWFNDWGRDSMIALPGLTLTTKRFDDAKGILNTFAQNVHNGLLPNNLKDDPLDRPAYNTSDATLWWFNALDSYVKALKEEKLPVDEKFVEEQYKQLTSVIERHIYGRHDASELVNQNSTLKTIVENGHPKLVVGLENPPLEKDKTGLGMEADGLLSADNSQLTWMDGICNGIIMTPREGKAVEINALWYNALRIMEGFANNFAKIYSKNGDSIKAQDEKSKAQKYHALANQVQLSMLKFWNPEKDSLKDLIGLDPEKRGGCVDDSRIRPNQIFALSLPHRPFDQTGNPQLSKAIKEQNIPSDIEERIFKTVDRELRTPYGLRTLAPGEDGFKPEYPDKCQAERDATYHQGTVWPWMIGAFADAHLNIYGDNSVSKEKVIKYVEPLIEHLQGNIDDHAKSGCCVGGIAEIFDATEPFKSKGTVQQAWSVSETLRVLAKVQNV